MATHLCQFMGQNSEIWGEGGVKKTRQRFGKTEPLDSKPRQMPQGCRTPPKMVPLYSLGTCPPKTPEHFDTPSLLHWEKIDFLKTPDFGQSTRMALELPKIDICQNWPKGVLGDVSSCLETKFDKKIPMGSVPNCRKEILMRTLLGSLSVNLNHLKTHQIKLLKFYFIFCFVSLQVHVHTVKSLSVKS